MISEPLMVIAAIIVVYGVFSANLSRMWISPPMAFMLVGLLVGSAGLGILEINVQNSLLEAFGEITLGLILFADAASTNANRLIRDNRLPLRLLIVGLPLTIALGTGVAHILFPSLSWGEKALIAAILAPTDAALGVAVVSSKLVPERIRQAILVESGLNDGLALPAVLFFAAIAYSSMEGPERTLSEWMLFAGEQIAIGAAVGLFGGFVLGKMISTADARGYIDHQFRNLVCIGSALLLLLGAHLAHGNGFIAAFVGGLVFAGMCQARVSDFVSFIEEEGQLFSLLIFFFFGVAIFPAALPFITVFCVSYALLSLTVIRMLPMAISLIGAKVSLPGTAFIGWFGPRGLASILFLFIAIEHQEMERLSQVEAIVYITVFLSVILHGITAPILSARYGNSEAAKRDGGTA
ncbi:MAG: cation:proton antiporter [Pseudomonadota bacterium]